METETVVTIYQDEMRVVYRGVTMQDNIPCEDCRKFIEALPADRPHGALHSDKLKFIGYREHSANYECRICHTKFHRDEKLPHGPPTWTMIE